MKKHDALLAKFREHNQRLGTSFADYSIDSELLLTDKDKKLAIAFDSESKKSAWHLGQRIREKSSISRSFGNGSSSGSRSTAATGIRSKMSISILLRTILEDR